MRLSAKGHSLDRAACNLCGKCVDICPGKALQIMGRPVSANDLYAEVATDRPFWERSGGGVTLSGGEPFIRKAGFDPLGTIASALSPALIRVVSNCVDT